MRFGKLQIIIIAVALLAALGAVLIFSGVIPGFTSFGPKETKKISVWGTIDEGLLAQTFADLARAPYSVEVSYQRKDPGTFDREFIDALARQAGPDLIIFPSDLILSYRDKLRPFSTEFVSERTFRDTFADGTEILIMPGGQILGLPLLIDPMVLYYNRDLFRNESVARAPQTWTEFLSTSRRLTKISSSGAIIQSGAALGVETNIPNYKEILSMLILQTGSPIVERQSLLVNFDTPEGATDVVSGAVRFYTDFTNPKKTSYSWTKVMPQSREAFSRELLAMYFGSASEYQSLRISNPHLNFDVAPVPQISVGKLNLTYGKFLALGIPIQSANLEAAMEAISFLISREKLGGIADATFSAPSRRDLLSAGPVSGDPALESIYNEAVKVKSWLDIDYARTSRIISEMIQFVYTGSKTEIEASGDAKIQLQALYGN